MKSFLVKTRSILRLIGHQILTWTVPPPYLKGRRIYHPIRPQVWMWLRSDGSEVRFLLTPWQPGRKTQHLSKEIECFYQIILRDECKWSGRSMWWMESDALAKESCWVKLGTSADGFEITPSVRHFPKSLFLFLLGTFAGGCDTLVTHLWHTVTSWHGVAEGTHLSTWQFIALSLLPQLPRKRSARL